MQNTVVAQGRSCQCSSGHERVNTAALRARAYRCAERTVVATGDELAADQFVLRIADNQYWPARPYCRQAVA